MMIINMNVLSTAQGHRRVEEKREAAEDWIALCDTWTCCTTSLSTRRWRHRIKEAAGSR